MDQLTKGLKGKYVVPEHSDMPTVTFITPKAVTFYISSVVTTICMFLNWFSLDLDLGFMRFSDVFGTVNIFTLASTAMKVKDVGGILGAYLPRSVTVGFAFVLLISVALMLAGVTAIALYVYAIILRIQGNDRTVRVGKMAALLTVGTALGFILLITCCVVAMEITEALGQVMGILLSGPCMFSLIGGVVSGYCAVRDMGFKEDVVIYHNGVIKIDNGPKWKCNCCYRNNLSRLERCYYCGAERKV